MKAKALYVLLLTVIGGLPLQAQTVTPVFPGATWATKTPAEVGMTSSALTTFSNYMGGRGTVVRYGYQVYSWGDPNGRGDVASACKPFYSHFLFKALEDGRIPSMDQTVVTWEPALNNLNAALGYKDRNITWRHMANQISCYGVSENPGTAYCYNDWQMALFFDTLFTKAYGATYSNVDANVLRPMLTDVLQCQDSPTFMAFGTGDRPGRVGVSPRDFARLGLLYLNKGDWNGTRLMSEAHAKEAVRSSLSNAIPQSAGVAAEMIAGQRSIGSTTVPDNQTDHMGSYSWLWWTNGADRTGARKWPNAPMDTFGAMGHGGRRCCVVIPSLDMVISWNDCNSVDTDAEQAEALRLLMLAVNGGAKPMIEQTAVDASHPQWFAREKTSPYFMCGPGDPEGFLYRGTRNADGTRTGDQMTLINKIKGTGANCIYMTVVRSHGGDGGSTENPFINSDPTQALDQDILNQWEDWFAEMDKNNITIFLLLYDDSARIWNTGDTVSATELSFIQGIVNRFEHHRNLVWCVAEEYGEVYSAARVANIAAQIRAADMHKHPIGVHKNSGLTFTEFADNVNIDQFTIQYNVATAGELHSGMTSAWATANGRYNLNMSENADHGTGASARQKSWATAMGGAYVMVLGMDIAGTAVSDLQDCGRLASFFESTIFNEMSPRDDLAYGGTQYLLAKPGSSYIAYASNLSGNMGVRSMTAGTYTFKWMDCATGATVVQPSVNVSSGDQSWPKPGGIGSELALYITDLAVDLTPPGPVTGLTATRGDSQVALNWTNPADADFSGVVIRYKTDGYPASPTDGAPAVDEPGAPGAADSYTHTGLANDVTHYYAAFAHDSSYNYSTVVTASATPASTQTPYAGVISLPGTIQAENYDVGGETISYHDMSPGNQGTEYRTDDVDIETTSDTGGGYNIGWGSTGEWLEYTVNVAASGRYDLNLRIAALAAGSFRILVNGQDATGAVAFPATGGWQTWATVTAPYVQLYAGQQVLRVVLESSEWNLNYISVVTSTGQAAWNTLGTTQTLGSGITPGIATDSVGNIHVVYMNGGAIYYRLGNSSGVFGSPESIPVPEGSGDYNSPHVQVDSNNVPHVVFEKDWTSSSKKAWYTNRIGGSWKTPIVAVAPPATDHRVNYPRLALYGAYAYVGAFVAGPTVNGKMARLTNLSTTPSVELTVDTDLWVPTPITTTDGRLFVVGRNGASGHYIREYSTNMSSVISSRKISTGTPEKTGEATAAARDGSNVVYAAGVTVATGFAYDLMWCNSTQRLDSGQNSILGLGNDANVWGENVYPTLACDTTARVYFAYRDYATGEGKTTILSGGAFASPVVFASSVTDRMRWNPHTAPVLNGGVYAVWDSGGVVYFRSVGVGSGTPDPTPPGPVANLTSAPGGGQVNLLWTNPSDSDFTGAMVRYKTSWYPTSPVDGTLAIDKSGIPSAQSYYVHTGLTNNMTYYYSVFAHDASSNCAGAVTTSSTPSSSYCFAESFLYPNSNLNGNSGWSGTSGAELLVTGQTLKIIGGTTNTESISAIPSCAGSGGIISARFQVKAGAGTTTLWSLYVDDAAGLNLARWYGSGTTARGRIGGTGDVTAVQNLSGTTIWDTCEVRINTAANTSEFLFNGTSIGTLSHASQGSGDAAGRLKFERIYNSLSLQNVYIDNLIVGIADTTPPNAPASFSATASGGQNALAWTNPTSTDFAETRVLFKTTGYPASRTDGTVIYSGTGTGYNHTGLTNGTRYYYAAYARDTAWNFSSGATATAQYAPPATILEAKELANGQVRTLSDKVVTTAFSGFFYIQEPDSHHGIKVVSSHYVEPGWEVDVAGVIGGAGAERFIDTTGHTVGTTAPGPGRPAPLGMANKSVGGNAFHALAPGIVNGIGPNNIGALVTVWGKVTQRQPTEPNKYFYISDGSTLSDGSPLKDGTQTGSEDNVGIRISADPALYPDEYVLITGIVSCFDSGGLRPVVLPAQ